MRLQDFNERAWQHLFGAYVKAHKSHWTGVPFETVKRFLEEKGHYEFGFESMGTWTSKFRLDVVDSNVVPTFVKNPDIKGRMKEHLDEMERLFMKELRPYA